MMAEHTKGPWEVDVDTVWADINGHPHKIWGIGNGEIGTAVVVLPEEDITDETEAYMEANARLIAAAPEMYEALEAAMEYIERSPCDPDINPRQWEAWQRLQALGPKEVLKKARGA